ncbi:hypothetical protein JKP88DRAFT_264153 [Tribonema minus]|uniref:Uncharacterized protein n=1 Tax=Tribonema minus TaxID=303371 RepID=A0A836CC29_9STRA|nr:hypothetical protein JKP88DRAFT_264153 [Tribonema minus]
MKAQACSVVASLVLHRCCAFHIVTQHQRAVHAPHAQHERSRACAPLLQSGSDNSSEAKNVESEKGIYGYDLEVVKRERAEHIDGRIFGGSTSPVSLSLVEVDVHDSSAVLLLLCLLRLRLQAPFRGTRLQIIAITAALAVICGATSVLGLVGVDSARELTERLSLPNPLLDAGVLAVAWYIYVEDVKVKRMRLREIDAVYQRELKGITLPGNRAGRRAAQVKEEKGKKKGKRSKKGGALAAVEAEPATSQPQVLHLCIKCLTQTHAARHNGTQAAAVAPENDSSNVDESKPGSMLDGWKQALKDVNQQSYAQALAMNSMLEEKGILTPLQRPQEQASLMPHLCLPNIHT